MIKLLDECSDKRKELRMIEEKIEEVKARATAPKNQSFDDMPRASSNYGNPIESYIEKVEQLEEKRNTLKKELAEKWAECLQLFESKNMSAEEIILLYYRFHENLSWRNCAKAIERKHHITWNDNKIYRIYRKIRKSLEM